MSWIQRCARKFHVQHSMAKHAKFAKMVLVGDSITQWFQTTGSVHYNKYFLHLKPVNVGVAGDTTDKTILRLNDGILDPLESSILTTLLIGTNDIGWGHSPERISNQIGKIIEILQKKLVGSTILLIGILPAHNSERAKKVNSLIEKYDNGKDILYLDMTKQFTKNDKIIPKLYMIDQLHLSNEGYRVLAETLQPIVEEILNK